MTLIDALERLKTPIAENARLLRVFLACGFTPLHLETFLAAHLRNLCSDRRVRIAIGLVWRPVGNLERLRPGEHDSLAVVIERADLDSRGWDCEPWAAGRSRSCRTS